MKVTFRMLGWMAVLMLAGPGSGKAADSSVSPSCATPEHRRLDFWAGDWDAFDVGGSDKPVARAHVDIILGGCALREIYEQPNGVVGQSFTIFDASRKRWHQTWVTNRGHLLVLEGEFRNGRMTLRATETTANGPVLWRGVWIPDAAGVRETAVTSDDGGRTWKPRFDMLFRRHGASSAKTPPRPSP